MNEYTAFELAQIADQMDKLDGPNNNMDRMDLVIALHEDFLDGNVDEKGEPQFNQFHTFNRNTSVRMITVKPKRYMRNGREILEWTFDRNNH